MIIYLNIDKSRLEKEGLSKNLIPELFSEIAIVSAKGYHRVMINPDIIECLSQMDLNLREKAQIEKLCQKFFESQVILTEGIPFLRVNYGEDELSGCNGFWEIGHMRLLKGNYLEKTILLVESDDDVDFFEFLLETEGERIKFGYFAYDPYAGHGKTISKTLKRCIDQHKIVLCICDSDKSFPMDECGDTCKALQNQKDKQDNDFIGMLACTPGREIENFLPIEIVNSVSGDQSKKYTENLKSLINQQGNAKPGDCLWLYYDIKDGVNWNRLQNLRESGTKEQKSWVKEKYDEHIKAIGCKDLPRYGKIMGNFLKNETEKDRFKAHMRIEGGYWELHYSNWVQSLLWYVCGEDPRYDRED